MKNKRVVSLLMAVILMLTLLPATPASAKAKTKLSAKSITMTVGRTKTIKLLNNKKRVFWSIENSNIEILSETKKKVKIRALKAGKSKVYASVGKKEYKCNITIEGDEDYEEYYESEDDYDDEDDYDEIPSTPEPTNKPTTEPATTSEPQPTATSKPTITSTPVPAEYNVEILAEYTLPDSIGWYTRRFMVVKNNSGNTVDISTSSIAYSKDGKMVSAANSSFDALGAGCTSVFYEAFETSEEIDHYDTDMSVKPSEYYKSVIQDLTYTQNNIKDGAIFQVTNNGKEAAEFVCGYALFFLGDKLVDFDYTYFTDDDSELKPGKTISKQINAYEDFTRIEFYLTGRRYI